MLCTLGRGQPAKGLLRSLVVVLPLPGLDDSRASARPPPPPESRLPSASSRLSQTRSSVERRLLIRAARFESASWSMTRWGYSANMRRCDRLGKVPAASLEYIPIGDVVKNTEEYEKRGVGHSVEG
jgi:hypothetical protein